MRMKLSFKNIERLPLQKKEKNLVLLLQSERKSLSLKCHIKEEKLILSTYISDILYKDFTYLRKTFFADLFLERLLNSFRCYWGSIFFDQEKNTILRH